MCDPRKITKYGVVESLVYEAVSSYICSMDIYAAEGKKLEDTMLLVLNRNKGHNHESYQDKFYNSVRLAATLLARSVNVCGTMRSNRCIPLDLEREGRHLKRLQSAFRRKGDIMVQM
jgi:hypothetical protein